MPHITSTSELLQLAEQYYSRKEYSQALKLLNQALTTCDIASARILDTRAATYARLGDNAAALLDAKQTIKLHGQDVTGYLRAGRILQRMGKTDNALAIYNHGIAKGVDRADLLQALIKKLSIPTSKDPFKVFPYELLDIILRLLTFRQRINCMRVCKAWYAFIASVPAFWRIIDLFTGSRGLGKGTISNKFISDSINRAQQQVTAATLSRLRHPPKVIASLVRSCRSLTSLTLQQSGVLSDELIAELVKSTALRTLIVGERMEIGLASAINLFKSCPTIEHIDLGAVKSTKNTYLIRIDADICPKLQSLRMVAAGDFRHWPPHFDLGRLNSEIKSIVLEDWTMSQNIFSQLSTLTSIRRLDVYSNDQVPSPHRLRFTVPVGLEYLGLGQTRDLWHIAAAELTEIKIDSSAHLWIMLHDQIDGGDFSTIAQSTSPLRKLTFRHMSSFELNMLYLPFFQLLEELHIDRDGFDINDDDLQKIVDALTRLHTITITCAKITGIGIKKLLKLKNLKRLRLRGIDMSMDAIEYARAQGVQVLYDCEMPSLGRKIRW